jgi:hypothetical protein
MQQSFTELDLAARIRQLQADRRRHAEAIAAIDQVLGRVGAALTANRPAPAEPNGSDPAGAVDTHQPVPKRRRGKFAHTAEHSVLEFIQRQRNPSTADINAHWRAEGRLGTSNVTLLRLLKSGAIRRVDDPNVRGSRYVLADAPAPPR